MMKKQTQKNWNALLTNTNTHTRQKKRCVKKKAKKITHKKAVIMILMMMMARKDFVNSIYQCLLLSLLLFKERVKMWMLFFWNEIFFFNHHIKIKSSDQQHKRNVKKIWYFLIRFFLLISPNIQITEWISFFSRRRFWLIKRSGWDMRKKMIEEKWGGNDLVVIDDVSLLFDYIKTKIIDWLILLKFKAKNEWNLNKTQIFLFFFSLVN